MDKLQWLMLPNSQMVSVSTWLHFLNALNRPHLCSAVLGCEWLRYLIMLYIADNTVPFLGSPGCEWLLCPLSLKFADDASLWLFSW